MKKTIYYYDVSKKGKDLLGTNDIPMITNEQAVMDSIYNLLATQPGTKLMNPLYGVDLNRYLFEPLDELTARMMQDDVAYALSAYEERIRDINTVVYVDEEQQTLIIVICFWVIFTNSQQEMRIDFKKLR